MPMGLVTKQFWHYRHNVPALDQWNSIKCRGTSPGYVLRYGKAFLPIYIDLLWQGIGQRMQRMNVVMMH